ncbi:amino acid adenylation domain-containing protein [Clostridium sp. 'deep sea']|uniref:non-ribosomal peptide synthetase n=1 Tax=Clostridium sp. 'deep sea' TaxID=2779445 RepID=UPI0018968FC0|nr:non-ribosomal peptide synthetase [Clostridium sp. 'deep sea']QOR34872.1 amino acid adenylation domain-containing protein [Clostridium sp. 'deep sea']
MKKCLSAGLMSKTPHQLCSKSIELMSEVTLSRSILKIAEQEKITTHNILLTAFAAILYKYTYQELITFQVATKNKKSNCLSLKQLNYSFTNKGFTKNCLQIDKQLQQSLNVSSDGYHHLVFNNINATNKIKYGILFNPQLTDRGLKITINYNAELFDTLAINSFANHYLNILTEIVENPRLSIFNLKMVSAKEKQQILHDFNSCTKPYPKNKTIAELFEQQALLTPNNTAVVMGNNRLTFKQLNQRANSLALTLQNKGVTNNDIVAIMAERSIELVVGIVAIIKAGAAYLPIDAEYPRQRINYMLINSKAQILLSQQKFLKQLQYEGEVIDLNDSQSYSSLNHNLETCCKVNDLAYVIYTSGTTGNPKGVAVKHQSVVRLVKNSNYLEFKQQDRLLQTCAMTFDVATFEIWGALLNGVELHLITKNILLQADDLGEYIFNNKITLMWLTSPLFNKLCEDNHKIFKPLRCLLIGGDVVSPKHVALVQNYAPNLTFINGYGPTENTTFSTCYEIKEKINESQSIPIGKPIANSTAYIFDKHNKIVAIGVNGELCVGGDGLAVGYLNNPELTAKKFVANPQLPNQLMYRTGDLARWLPNGNIEFVGRIDYQVKIRGFRIELGEIESSLLTHPQVKQTVVLAKLDENNNKYLACYYKAEGKLKIYQVREFLAKQLPDYMIPTYFKQLEQMPLNTNGKINRKALPEPDVYMETGIEYKAAENSMQQNLINIFEKVLKVNKIGINDDFFTLGGDSLKAIKIINLIKKELKLALTVGEIFSSSSICKLANHLKHCKSTIYADIKRVETQKYYEASSAQKRIYIASNMSLETNYNIPFVLELQGDLDKQNLEQSFKKLIARHEALRTSFSVIDNKIVQEIQPTIEFKLDYIELNDYSEQQLKKETCSFIKPFNLAQAPLLRAKLIKFNEQKQVLLIDMHHIISDGVSLSILTEELSKLYNGIELTKAKVQYKDYTTWEKELHHSSIYQEQEKYWLNTYKDIPVLNLPTDFTRTRVQSFEGDSIKLIIPEQLKKQLKKVAYSNNASLYMVLLAAYNVLLTKYTGQEDIIVGAAAAGRSHADLQNMVGMFVNTLALRNQPVGHKEFTQFLKEVKNNAFNAYENQDYQLEDLINKLELTRDFSHGALINTMFVMQNTGEQKINFNGVKAQQIDYRGKVAKFDITLDITEEKKQLTCYIEYCTKLFKQDNMQRFATHYFNILKNIAKNSSVQIADINILTSEEQQQLLIDFNDTAVEYPKHKTIAQLFEEQVEKTPNQTALVFESCSLSYDQLNKKANSLAHKLRDQKITANSVVAIMADKSLELIVGILAIVKAGAAYLPIAGDCPKARIDYMLSNSGSHVLLTQQQYLHVLEFEGLVINLNEENYHDNNLNPAVISGPEDLAYIIYTSGTTGKPKGVAVKQQSVVRLIMNTNFIEFKPQDKLLQTCAMTFDVATFEIWGALFNGLEMHLTTKDVLLQADKLGDYLTEFNISIMWLTSPLFNKLCEDNSAIFKGLRCLLIGGDVVLAKNVALVKNHDPNITVINGYGPTENTTFSTCYVIDEVLNEQQSIPIGAPIANSTAYVLDNYNKLVPIGVFAELCVGGDGLAQGYFNNPELTAQKFVENPYVPGQLMYHTGDLVRWLPDGNIEFLGRKDFQVKIRGFRIELGEIESSLLQLPAIKQAVVIAKQEADSKYLIAYLVSDYEYSTPELRESLKKDLPDYMIPSYFIRLPQLPLNQSGKIDRKALPEPTNHLKTVESYIAARNVTEEILVEIWREVLNINNIGIDNDFFVLGGDSLKAVKIVTLINNKLKTNIVISDIFKHANIRKLAEYLKLLLYTEQEVIVTNKVENADLEQDYAVSSVQKRMFALYQMADQDITYNIPTTLVIDGDLDYQSLNKAFYELVRRHEAFRTTFKLIEGEVYQKISATAEFEVVYDTLKEATDVTVNKVIKDFIRPFNLSQGPLIRVKLLKVKPNQHILILDMHHIISDGTSMAIILDEFSSLYSGKELPALKQQYRDYAAWEAEFLESDYLKQQENYWLNKLSDEIPVLNLPTDYKRPKIQSFAGDVIYQKLTYQLTKQLKQVAKEQRSTLNMVLLAAYNILLAKYSGQEDIIVGTASSGRPNLDMHKMVGMFVNTLAIRNYPKGSKTFAQFLQDVKFTFLDAFENQYYQFDMLVDKLNIKRDLSRNALFDTMFVFQSVATDVLELPNAKVKALDIDFNISKFDITLEAQERDGLIKLALEYCTKLFKPVNMQRFMSHYINILKSIVKNQNVKIADINMLSNQEQKQLLIDFNNTTVPYPKHKTIAQLFEEQVEKTPHQTALVFEGNSLSYAQLNEKANALAFRLREQEVSANSIVAIMADRSLELIVGILAIVKAGAAYLPIAPDYPKARIDYMLSNSGARIILTQQQYLYEQDFEGSVINLNEENHHANNLNPPIISGPEDLAYIIYTSGTTGKPKGVAVKQQSVVRLIMNTNFIEFKPEDKLLQTCAMTFDVATFEIWGALFNGIEMHLTTKDVLLQGDLLGDYLTENNISIMWLTSPLFNKLCEDSSAIFKGLRCLLIGGDVVSPKNVALVQKHDPNVTIINGYGPTENTTFSTCYVIEEQVNEQQSIPIGAPIANSTAYVLDNYKKLVPIGVFAELCVGGDGLAQGYFNNPELTSQKFVSNPYVPGELMYHTGDLVRWLPNGSLEFLGRKDHQVKIRGFRIELGEITNQLLQIAGISEALVIDLEKDETKYLCAYYVADTEYSATSLREKLKSSLPDYMIPSYFVALTEMPLNESGKIDRKALPAPQGNIETGASYEQAHNNTEKHIVDIWSEVLNVNKIGINDDFFALGGDSLKAVKIIALIETKLGLKMSVSSMFRYTTIAELAKYLNPEQDNAEENETIEAAVQESINSEITYEYHPVSSVQKRMYVVNQVTKQDITYNIPMILELNGELNYQSLEKAFNSLIDRHEVFRTAFELVDGEVCQKIYPKVNFKVVHDKIEEVNENTISEVIEEFISPFNLSLAPLIRVKLLKLNSTKHMLMVDMHHIISDGTSMGIILDEFSKLYQGIQLPELTEQYKDYAVWEKEFLHSNNLKQQELYWLAKFKDEIPVLNLPLDFKRPITQSFKGSHLQTKLTYHLTKQLKQVAKNNKATLNMVLLAAYNILLAKYSGQEDIIIGTASAGRPELNMHKMVGMFVNTLALRNYPKGSKTFAQFLEEVKYTSLDAFENQYYQFDMLVDKLNIQRDLSRNALFDTMFNFQSNESTPLALPQIKAKPYNYKFNISKFDLSLDAHEYDGLVALTFEYCTKLFKQESIQRFMTHYINILKDIVANSNTKIADMNMLCEQEQKQLLIDFNNTAVEYPKHKTIAQLFEEQVDKTPKQMALVFEDNKLSYAQLNDKANSLAHHLREQGITANSIVAIMAEKSLELIVGILAIVKSGAAYLPIDPSYPQARVHYMLKNSDACILLTQKQYVNNVEFSGTVINLNEESYHVNTTNPIRISGPQDLAYIIYTSGTTGQPKGVAVKQQSVIRLIMYTNYIEFKPEDKLLQTCAMTFDVATFEIWGALFNGLEMHLTTKDVLLQAEKLADYLVNNKISIMWLTSPLFNKLCEDNPAMFKGLRCLLVGGDVVSPKNVALVQKHDPNTIIINGYGPTENTTFSTCYVINDLVENQNTIPIGAPIANSTAYVLDKYQKLVPVGVYGELCVGGDGLAQGYYNNPELTALKFIANPYVKDQLMYRTGDLVRWLPNGNIDFLGRVDHQVKIRGFRIELGEIESSLLQIPGISEALVMVRENDANKYLCAYYVASKEYSSGSLREILLNSLPDYMIPSYFMALTEMPLNQSGKIDRKALPVPKGKIETGASYEQARNETEKRLVEMWSEILNIDTVGIDDDFFALGGHSLKAIKIVAFIQKQFKTEITVSEIFRNSTIRKLALYIGKTQKSNYAEIEVVKKQEYYEVSAAQKRMFALNQFSKSETNYNIPLVLLLEGKVDVAKLKYSFNKLAERHEAFRTSFEMIEDDIIQRITPQSSFKLAYEETSSNSKDVVKSKVDNFIKPFDLSQAPLFRAKLVKLANEKYLLMFDMHHIVSDGVSLSIIMNELTKHYQGVELPAIKLQYKDYSVWQNKILESQAMKKHEEFWLSKFNDEIPVLNLPTDYARPSSQNFKGSTLGFNLDNQLTLKLKKLCKENNVTLYMLLLAAYNVLLAKYSGQEDIVVGSPIAGRQHADLYNMVGVFINTLAMRNYPAFNKSFKQFLQEVNQNSLNAYEHQDYQFDKLVEKLDVKRELSRNALFDVMFILQNTDNIQLQMDSVKVTSYEFEADVAKFDMTLTAYEDNNELYFNLNYSTMLFKQQTISRMLQHYKAILHTIIANADLTIGEINMLTLAEKEQILTEFNNTKTDYNSDITIVERFEQLAKANAQQLAVVYESQQLTYQQLNEKANQLARLLRHNGVKPDSIVGILLERSTEMMIAIMAILKAGGAYLPISPEYPEDRIKYMLQDSNANIILTEKELKATSDFFEGLVFEIDNDDIYEGSINNLEQVVQPHNLAYIIYTSGSTGKPKGVMIQHGSVINLVTALNKNIYNQYGQGLNITLIAPYVFDASVKQIFASLLGGHCLHIVPEECRYMGSMLVDYYIEHHIDVSDGTPSHFKLILGDDTNALKDIPVKHFIIGGEALPVQIVNEFLAFFNTNKPKITNIYGPTECCVDTTAFLVNEDQLKQTTSIPIGKPLANYLVYVLDKSNKLQPIGVPGELCIGGVGLARGYLNRPELTDKKFVDNPFVAGEKMYRTGDLVKWLENGDIEFLGRIDYQVKIRGYRIEIGEIDSVIKNFPTVQDSIVIAKEDNTSEKKLVAYVVPKSTDYSETELKEHLKNQLPKYMVPAALVKLAKMPLNANGKVDRFALPEPNLQLGNSEDFVAPRNEEEQQMANLWAEILELTKIGIDDDFFDVGGDSFKAIKLVRKISNRLSVMELFKNSTIRELVAHLAKAEDETAEKTMLNELTNPVKDRLRIASLVCFPYGGGSAISYQPLANALPKYYSLYAVELPGHDFSRPEEDLVSIEESVERCLQEILETVKGPIVLYGHCLGATMAAYMAYRLKEAGREVQGVIVAAMFPAPRISNWFFKVWDKIFPSQLTTQGNRDLLRAIGGLTSDISAEEAEFTLRNLKHDSEQCIRWYTEVYNNKNQQKLEVPFTCIVGDGDRITEFYQERYKEWQFFSEDVDLKTIKYGGHFFFKNQADDVAVIIDEKVKYWKQAEARAEVAAALPVCEEEITEVKKHKPKELKLLKKKEPVPSMRLFLLVAIMQIISEMGSSLAFFATSFWLVKATNISGFAFMMLIRVIPQIVVLPFSGAIVDRFDRRLIMVITDIMSAIASIALLMLILTNNMNVTHIYIFTVIGSIALCFRQPAYMAAITQITPKMYLGQANSVAQFSVAFGTIIGSLSIGLIMSRIGLSGIIAIDIVSFIVAIVVMLKLRFPDTMFNKSEEPILKELTGGLRFIAKRKSMIAMVVFFLVMNFLYGIYTVILQPLVVSYADINMYGIVNSFTGIGMLLGAIVMLFTGGFKRRAIGMVGFVAPFSVAIFITGIRPTPIFAIIGALGVCFSLACLEVHWRFLIQVKVGFDLQGRVFSVNRMLVQCLQPISFLSGSYITVNVFPKLLQHDFFNIPVVKLLVSEGASRPERLALLITGILMFIWTIMGLKYKPLSNMDEILPDASQGAIVVKDKDKLQEMIDKQQEQMLTKK